MRTTVTHIVASLVTCAALTAQAQPAPAQPQSQQAQVNYQHRAAQQAEPQQVHGLDDRKKPERLANELPKPRRLTLLAEPQHQIGKRHGVPTTQLDAQLMKSDCGWMSQENQL